MRCHTLWIKVRIGSLLFIIVLFLSLMLVNAKVETDTYSYKWTDTYLTIPVGEAIDDYKYMPKAKLFKNGTICTDADITYDREGDWLYYFKNVNTSKVGIYKVWYKAYDNVYVPGTCLDYKCLVTFDVVDLYKPQITIINKNVSVRRGSSYNYSDNVTVVDNYTKTPEVKFTGEVDLNKVGTYEVLVTAIDESQNSSTDTFNINVFSDSKPVIQCMNSENVVKIPYKNSFDISTVFKAYDSIDGDISDSIVYPRLDTSTLGEYEYTVSVKNSSDLEVNYTVIIKVIDDVKPTLVLTTHSLILDYNTNFRNYDFTKYIKTLTDNQDIDYDSLVITNTIENKVGSYFVSYSYSDGIYTVSDSIDVTLVSFDPPEVTVNDIKINVKENINYLEYIDVYDPSDANVKSSIEIDDSQVKYDEGGTYYATIYCVNSSGLSTTKRFKVIVEDESFFATENQPTSITIIVLASALGVVVLGIAIYALRNKKENSN